jgi:hypothetical protein
MKKLRDPSAILSATLGFSAIIAKRQKSFTTLRVSEGSRSFFLNLNCHSPINKGLKNFKF